jgi:type I restriction enzyme S subunit
MKNESLKPGWKVWRFDQMATNVNVRIENPSESGMEHYVGLEHLDADSLRIRRWGSPDDVEATKLMFKKGDIIFGRRRAYQRKLGVAEFDGICSAHAMVLRAKPDVVLPEFLPFFMQSDLFMKRAVEISVGSLSPTINWKTMAVQEFAVPPVKEQQSAVTQLRAAADYCYALEDAYVSTGRMLQALKDSLLGLDGSELAKSHLLGGLLLGSPESGCSAPPKDAATGYFVLGLAALSREGYVSGDFKPVEPTSKMVAAKLLPGDLLISRSNTVDRVGYVGVFSDSRDDVSFPDTMMRLRPNPELVRPDFLEALLQTTSAREYLMRIAAGTSASMKKINRANLLQMRLNVPSLDIQDSALGQLQEIKKAVSSQKSRWDAAAQLAKLITFRGIGGAA